jgi:GNAT superfamily N-acetyltransferase
MRRYTPADYDAVVAFIQEHGDRHILGIPEKCSRVRVGFIEERKGKIVGYSAMSQNQKYSITVVHRDYRGQGIASDLLRAKVDWARAHGYKYVETKVGATNHASIGMLNKMGYVVVGLGTSVTGKPVLTMRLWISANTPIYPTPLSETHG